MEFLIKHKVQKRKGILTCMLCRKEIKQFYNMQRHLREVHLQSDVDYHCLPCDKYFKSKRGLRAHISRFHHAQSGEVKYVDFFPVEF